MEFIGSMAAEVAKEVGKALFAPAKHHTGYLFYYKSKINNLKSEVAELVRTKNDILGRVNAARRNGEVIHEEVLQWLSIVDGIEVDAARLGGEDENRRCFKGCCLNWSSNYSLGKEAAKKLADVDRFKAEGRNFSCVSNYPPPPTIDSWPTREIEAFASRELTIEKIISALEDEENIIVGVYGMGGVGKTTLMKQIGKRLKREKVFNEVVMVSVTPEPGVRKIQYDIAGQLGLELAEKEIESIRAGRLLVRLKQESKILVILDDIWGILELADIGIPYGDDYKGCKIVLTTRNTDICDTMGTQEAIAVSILPEEESWDLFKKNAGDVVDSPAMKTVAQDIVKECGGLPLAIVTLGRALRNKDKTIWTDALLQLNKSNPENIEDMNTKVFASLELSYNFLGNEKIKSFFLFCCLFPENRDIDIDILVRYGIGDGLQDGVDTLKQARDRVHSWVNKLKASCLLLDGDEEGCVKMHDVVRDVAILIASKEHGFLVQPDGELREWPEKKLESCKKISLLHNRITELSNPPPKCSRLQTLLLQRNYSLKKITDTFFQGMKRLNVLDLSGTRISSLPKSSQFLTNLRTLCLDGCIWLEDISLIGGLKKLEILSLASSGIRELPTEIGGLTHLKLLDLTGTAFLERIPPNVISQLCFLEELHMEGSFSGWEVEGKSDRNNASFGEVASLAHLTALYIHVRNTDCLSHDISAAWRKLTMFCVSMSNDSSHNENPRFRISAGHHTCSYSEYPNSTVLENIGNPVSNWVKVLLESIRDLYLVCCKGFADLLQLESHGFNSLEVLHLFRCSEMEYLISSAERGAPPKALENLEKLVIVRMENLKMFCDGPIPSGFLGKLRVLDVSKCNNFITILLPDLLRRVDNLEKLKVQDCQELEEVFQFEEPLGRDFTMPLLSRLRKLKLKHLPKLKRIWKGAVSLESLGNLEDLYIERCMSLRCLFSAGLAQNLQPKTFENLRVMFISSCNGLKNLMPMSLARGLPKLEELCIHCCDGMEEIIAKEERETVMDNRTVFPLLKIIHLVCLPRLKALCQRDASSLEWPSLTHVEVGECPKLKRLCMGLQSAPNLEEIIGEREWLEGLEWEEEGSAVSSRLQPLFKARTGQTIFRNILMQSLSDG
ncbi:disease resistance protein SUMM2-like isoform X2 [Magnolia sinica]|uniref:disease resistance protein SUMM2-like isoform X2 n=1 Tax=Magnolia sinica TaxID=86752 RepID=UPI00265ABA8B|nr:disease resistance protein SUMM2-like isoform X2 [Magnolia sinica]